MTAPRVSAGGAWGEAVLGRSPIQIILTWAPAEAPRAKSALLAQSSDPELGRLP
jgi:hypothetical protein